MTYTNDQLRAWAAQAAAELAAELDLFGITDHAVAITPAAVRAVLRVVEAAQPPATPAPITPLQAVTLTDPAPVARLSDPPPQATPPELTAYWPTLADLPDGNDPMPHLPVTGAPAAPQRTRRGPEPGFGNKAAQLPAVFAFIRSIARDGYMPSQGEYEGQRPPGLPSRMTVNKLTGKTWAEIAAELGLPLRGAARKASASAPAENRLAEVGAFLQERAAEGRMLSQRVYDKARPPHVLNAGSVTRIAGVSWTEFGARYGLKPALNPSRSAEKVEMMRAKARQAAAKPEPTAPATKPAPPVVEIAVPALSAQTAAILGPEHVIVTPYRNGNGQHTPASNGANLRAARLEEIKAALRDMALVDGRMPKMSEWNARKPAHLPSAGALMMQYDFRDWGAVAKFAGLPWIERDRNRRGGDDE